MRSSTERVRQEDLVQGSLWAPGHSRTSRDRCVVEEPAGWGSFFKSGILRFGPIKLNSQTPYNDEAHSRGGIPGQWELTIPSPHEFKGIRPSQRAMYSSARTEALASTSTISMAIVSVSARMV